MYRLTVVDNGDFSKLCRAKWRPCEFGGKTFLSAGTHQHVAVILRQKAECQAHPFPTLELGSISLLGWIYEMHTTMLLK